MALKGITANTPPEAEPHIYAEDDAAIYQSIFGKDGVFNIGQKFKATVLSNNKVRIADGMGCIGGHVARQPYGEYEDMEISNGQTGYNRNDIIVAKFITTGTGGIDTMAFQVVQGAAVQGTATDPILTKDELYNAGKIREMPLYRIKIEGISIVKVEQMFETVPTVPDLERRCDELNSALKNLYPVGSIYLSTVNKNPSEYFGGTWVQWGAGRVPVGVSADAEFNSVEKTGGAKTVTHAHETKGHTLTLNEIPSHTHYSGERLGFAGQSGSSAYSYNFEHYATGQSKKSLEWTWSGGNGSHSHGNTYDSANSVLQPYITCYMWKRTA